MSQGRHIRLVIAENAGALDRLGEAPPEGTASFLGQVYDGGSLSTESDRVVLMHPVEVDGDSGEGDAPTFVVDETRSIPVVAIGSPAPKAGDKLEAFAVGGKWVAEVGCAAGAPACIASAPKQNLTISWANGQTGGGSATLAFDPSTCTWDTGCGLAIRATLDGTTEPASLRLRAYVFDDGSCPDGTPLCDCPHVPLVGQSVSPFLLTFQISNASCNYLWVRGYSQFTVSL